VQVGSPTTLSEEEKLSLKSSNSTITTCRLLPDPAKTSTGQIVAEICNFGAESLKYSESPEVGICDEGHWHVLERDSC
jgi:hypothetical protein